MYGWSDSTKAPVSGIEGVSEPRIMSCEENAQSSVHVDQNVSAITVVEVKVSFKPFHACMTHHQPAYE